MRLPFSRDQFFAVFSQYNEAVWPLQILLGLLALALVAIAMRAPTRSRWLIMGIAALWIWMAVGYHLAFFARINSAAVLFAALFLVEAGLILWYGFGRRGLVIRRPSHVFAQRVGWLLMIYALIVYPLAGYLVGHRYPAAPTFGLPCPTTIFTLGLFAWSLRPISWVLLVVPILWALIGTSAAVQLGMIEDLGLPVAAMLVVIARVVQRLPLAAHQVTADSSVPVR